MSYHDDGPDGFGACSPGCIGALIVLGLMVTGVMFLVWTLLAWSWGVR